MTGHLDFTEQISHLITPIVKGRRAIYLGRQRSRETEPLWRFSLFLQKRFIFFSQNMYYHDNGMADRLSFWLYVEDSLRLSYGETFAVE